MFLLWQYYLLLFASIIILMNKFQGFLRRLIILLKGKANEKEKRKDIYVTILLIFRGNLSEGGGGSFPSSGLLN